MNSIWEVLIVVVLVFIGVSGLVSMGEKVFTTQTIDTDSLELLSGYSDQANAYKNNFTQTINTSNIDPYLETDLNEVDGFVQQYRLQKGRVDQLQDLLFSIYKVPDLIINVVPFVEPSDMGIYVDLYRTLVWVLLLMLVIIGYTTGRLLPLR